MKRKEGPPAYQQQLADLAERIKKLNLPDGWFDGEIDDVCQEEAVRTADSIKEESVLDQLHFLYMRGYDISRLEEIANEPQDGV